MSFEFNSGTHVRFVYYCSDGGTQDWMAVTYQQPNERASARYRFRYYASMDPHDQNDVKRWYDISHDDPAHLDQSILTVATMLAGLMGTTLDVIKVDGDQEKMLQLLSTKEWCHMRKVLNPKEQVRYVPHHAHGDASHPDCEDGFVVTDTGKDNVFVRYWQRGRAGGALRTTSCSEATPRDCLVPHKSTSEEQVDAAWASYVAQPGWVVLKHEEKFTWRHVPDAMSYHPFDRFPSAQEAITEAARRNG